MMLQVKADIDVSIDKHAKFIDIETANQSKKLNEILATFSLISIACLPATVVGGLFGMNVKVPFFLDICSFSSTLF
jgi:Mg2+ and Co2+ transporter CorA